MRTVYWNQISVAFLGFDITAVCASGRGCSKRGEKRVKPLRSGPRNGQVHVHASQNRKLRYDCCKSDTSQWRGLVIVSNSYLPLPGLTTATDIIVYYCMDSNYLMLQADTSSTPNKRVALVSHKESKATDTAAACNTCTTPPLTEQISLTSVSQTHCAFVYYGRPN